MKKSYYLILIMAAILVLAQCKPGTEKETAVVEEIPEVNLEEIFIPKGNAIVDTTFKTLSAALKKAVVESGISGAIEYCNVNAYPLTDQLSKDNDAIISRKSQKYRNPDNQTDATDDFVYDHYSKSMASNQPMEPILLDHPTENMISYYKPIMQLEFCGTCHSSKESIGLEYEAIAALYPEDLAVDFETGDLRGLWRVDFDKIED